MATKTITVVPNAYTLVCSSGSGSASNITNAYNDTSNTTYATITTPTTASVTTTLSFTFDFSDIPSNATITSVTGKVKACVSNTSQNRTSTFTAQLYNNTTAMGSSYSIGRVTTATAASITCGTWTRAQLDNLKLEYIHKRGTSTSSLSLRVYGSELTITYEEDESEYTITTAVSPAGSGTVTGGGTYEAGSSVTLTATPNSGYAFVEWQDDNTDNPRTFTPTSSATYTAYFAVRKTPIRVKVGGAWKVFDKNDIHCKVDDTWHSLGTTGDVWVKYGDTKWLSIYGDYNIDKKTDPVIDPETGEESKIKEDYEPKGETFSGTITLTGGALDATGNEKDYIKVVLDLTNCTAGNDVWEEVLSINNSVSNLSVWESGVHIYFNNDGGGTSTMHSLTGKCFAIENGSTKKDWIGDQTLDNNQITIIINSTGVHVYTDEACTNDISTQTLSNANISGSTTVAIGSMEGSGRSNAKFVSIEYVYYEAKE